VTSSKSYHVWFGFLILMISGGFFEVENRPMKNLEEVVNELEKEPLERKRAKEATSLF
jgi:hypothetical protein